ncbi:MAG: MATE family efflux transporter, partial [Anaerolineae bacterium]|nr:MATE family efflux transporter [Anaerolineae bacterium]
MKSQINTILDFFRDYEYYRQLMRLAVPIALQNLITSSLNMVALIFIGQLGEESVAAVGLGNQIWFLLNLVVFGICSGSAMFVAQLWGKRDIPNIRKVLGLTIKLSLIPALFFWIVAVFFPSFALGIYTKDAQVILIGSKFLSIYGWSYLFFAMTAVFSTAARSTGNVRLPLIVSTSAL